MRLVIDANIPIAALLKDATTREILLEEDVEFFAPECLLIEIQNALKNPKFRKRIPLNNKDLSDLASAIFSRITFFPEKSFLSFIKHSVSLVTHIEDAPLTIPTMPALSADRQAAGRLRGRIRFCLTNQKGRVIHLIMRIYIDTSVINGLYAQDSRIVEITKYFFQSAKFGKFTLYSSTLLSDEIKETADIRLRQRLINAVEEYQVQTLPLSEEVSQLARNYLKEKIIPVKYIADAIHIAVATIHNIPVLVSWNFEHIVKHKTRVEVNRVNKENGYSEIDICSPEEV